MGPRLDVHYRDMIEIPSKIWLESIKGRSALLCWSQNSESSSISLHSSNDRPSQPEFYQIHLWISEDQHEDQANILRISSTRNDTAFHSFPISFHSFRREKQ